MKSEHPRNFLANSTLDNRPALIHKARRWTLNATALVLAALCLPVNAQVSTLVYKYIDTRTGYTIISTFPPKEGYRWEMEPIHLRRTLPNVKRGSGKADQTACAAAARRGAQPEATASSLGRISGNRMDAVAPRVAGGATLMRTSALKPKDRNALCRLHLRGGKAAMRNNVTGTRAAKYAAAHKPVPSSSGRMNEAVRRDRAIDLARIIEEELSVEKTTQANALARESSQGVARRSAHVSVRKSELALNRHEH